MLFSFDSSFTANLITMRLTANSIGYDYDAEPDYEIDEDYLDAKRDQLRDEVLRDLREFAKPLGGDAEAIRADEFQVFKWGVELALTVSYDVSLDRNGEVTSEDYTLGMGRREVCVSTFAEAEKYLHAFFKFVGLDEQTQEIISTFLSK